MHTTIKNFAMLNLWLIDLISMNKIRKILKGCGYSGDAGFFVKVGE